MSNYVIDASVALKWFIWEEGTEEAHQLLDQLNFFWVPDLFLTEIDAILTKKVRRGELEVSDAFQKRKVFRQLPYKIIPFEEISEFAFHLSTAFPVTFFDATYLAVAVDYEAIFYTADKRLVKGMVDSPFEENIGGLNY
ncbi:type II toxin-antitoxin system VapC family toxin [Fodinibius halophilus]|uniref:Type II toxin-antitoxin system VapC family toxin n=1 Tax=Fodinibius halophilus TaxID=1736908 RepID=A0A6M1T5F3_9BACT|nr:type II toxin-antitoxin system VapC family toxin [Fodinibius halophilus]